MPIIKSVLFGIPVISIKDYGDATISFIQQKNIFK